MRARGGAIPGQTVHQQAFLDDFTDRQAGAERTERVLKHDLHPLAQRPQRLVRQTVDALPLEADRALLDSRRSSAKPSVVLPEPAFAHHAEGLPFPHADADAIHRLHVSVTRPNRPRLSGNQTFKASPAMTSGASAATGGGSPLGSAASN
jgi:hypothetical protein